MKLMYDTIVIEGVDKTGKDTVTNYLRMLSNNKYCCYSRGVISDTVYEMIYGRTVNQREVTDNVFSVLLTADKDDLKVRFKLTKEPEIDIDKHLDVFMDVFYTMTVGKFSIEFNTSEMTPFTIAKNILEIVDYINENEIKHPNQISKIKMSRDYAPIDNYKG